MSSFTSWFAKQGFQARNTSRSYVSMSLSSQIPFPSFSCLLLQDLLFCFVLLFSSVGDLKLQILNWPLSVRSQDSSAFWKEPNQHEIGEPWSILFPSDQTSTKHFSFQPGDIWKVQFTCTHFNAIYCILLECSVQIGFVLHNHPFSKKFTVEVKEGKMAMTRRERLRFNT